MTIVDVRILVEGVSDVEVVSRALKGLTLGGEYGITVSAIIPTTNLDIARRAAKGADLVIIATDADKVGRGLAERLTEELEGKVGAVERMKLPPGHDLEHVDVEIVRKEIKDALVRAGLKTLQLLPRYRELEEENLELRKKIESLDEISAETPKVLSVRDVWNRLFPGKEPPGEDVLGEAILKLGLAGKVIVGQGHVFSTDPKLVEDLMRAVYLSEMVRE